MLPLVTGPPLPAGGAAAGEVTKPAIPESLAPPDENVAKGTESAELPELVDEEFRLIFDWAFARLTPGSSTQLGATW